MSKFKKIIIMIIIMLLCILGYATISNGKQWSSFENFTNELANGMESSMNGGGDTIKITSFSCDSDYGGLYCIEKYQEFNSGGEYKVKNLVRLDTGSFTARSKGTTKSEHTVNAKENAVLSYILGHRYYEVDSTCSWNGSRDYPTQVAIWRFFNTWVGVVGNTTGFKWIANIGCDPLNDEKEKEWRDAGNGNGLSTTVIDNGDKYVSEAWDYANMLETMSDENYFQDKTNVTNLTVLPSATDEFIIGPFEWKAKESGLTGIEVRKDNENAEEEYTLLNSEKKEIKYTDLKWNKDTMRYEPVYIRIKTYGGSLRGKNTCKIDRKRRRRLWR